MNLLIFFALPLATILLAIVFQKVLKCQILVAITFFAIYLIILFSLYAAGVITNLAEGLIAVIIYTIIAFLTAWIARIISLIKNRLFNCDESQGRSSGRSRNRERESSCGCYNENNDLLKISCRCNNGNSQNLLTINSDCLGTADNNNNENSCGCVNNNDIATQNNRSDCKWKCYTQPS